MKSLIFSLLVVGPLMSLANAPSAAIKCDGVMVDATPIHFDMNNSVDTDTVLNISIDDQKFSSDGSDACFSPRSKQFCGWPTNHGAETSVALQSDSGMSMKLTGIPAYAETAFKTYPLVTKQLEFTGILSAVVGTSSVDGVAVKCTLFVDPGMAG